jgi:hypothetical protein
MHKCSFYVGFTRLVDTVFWLLDEIYEGGDEGIGLALRKYREES